MNYDVIIQYPQRAAQLIRKFHCVAVCKIAECFHKNSIYITKVNIEIVEAALTKI